jgi:hypothetical protein
LRASRKHRRATMALDPEELDPEELVTLTDHGMMKLRLAVLRAMMMLPKQRKLATIVRDGDPAILNFDEIKKLAVQWNKPLVPID